MFWTCYVISKSKSRARFAMCDITCILRHASRTADLSKSEILCSKHVNTHFWRKRIDVEIKISESQNIIKHIF